MTDPNQFEAFMRAYQNMVYTTAVRLLGNEAEAEDMAQEVFLKAYNRFEELKESPTVGGWLKTVTTNLCLNHLSRYRSRWSFFSELTRWGRDEEESDFELTLAAPEEPDYMDEADQKRILEQVLQKLPASQRVPLVLFHFDGKTYEEIAAQLKVSLSKVKTDIFRGRNLLREKLKLGWLSEAGLPAGQENRSPNHC